MDHPKNTSDPEAVARAIREFGSLDGHLSSVSKFQARALADAARKQLGLAPTEPTIEQMIDECRDHVEWLRDRLSKARHALRTYERAASCRSKPSGK